ncbi:DUF3157 family protein [Vibrio ostreicida]|uniref:DUF3157 family protein n=1 Tax=Vibrio ostreicida TaxID=526588 RepID=A0ABT8BQI4_9VIBR|nr:DUF3157 family protein [Vibrio ostreicida]MDN3608594.1 DUF3157 family protein [Vibrio ostreicida]NPD10989.1 DUF3157 family protein [Vibrio ostreicida]
MNKIIGLACLLTSSVTLAQQTVTLDDGRQIQLNDDFTWSYLDAPKPTKDLSPPENLLIAQIPIIEKTVGTIVTLGNRRATMQLSDSGVDVLLDAVQYDHGQLIIPTSVTNQSSQSVILVEVEIEVAKTSGERLAKRNIKIWQSIKRLAETYLRPQQAEIGTTIKLNVDLSEQYLITAKVINVETR